MNDILTAQKAKAREGGASFTMRNRVLRALWALCWGILAAWTPPPLFAWRRIILILFGAKMGKGARVYGSTKIWLPSNLVMGDHAVMGWSVNCYNQGMIYLDDFAIVSQYSHLVAGSHDIHDKNFQLFTKPVHIEKYAWIASRAFVGPGVTVHQGAVLGACAVTFKDLEPWTVYLGNPATKHKLRTKFI